MDNVNYTTHKFTGTVKSVFKSKNFDETGFVNVVIEAGGKIGYAKTKQGKSIQTAINSKDQMKKIILRKHNVTGTMYFLSAVKG